MTSVRRARDGWTWLGIAVVAAAAAVMSFSALRDLAERADVAPALAWLLPVAIDAAVVVSTRVWLIGNAGSRVTRYARFLALSALALSVAGNAAEHAMAAYRLAAPWWVLVAVSAVPPVALGATVHLAALLATDTATVTATATEDDASSQPATDTQPQLSGSATAEPTPEPREVIATPMRAATKATAAGDKEALMRATFERYRAEGRLEELTGAELARIAGAASSLGRRYRKKWLDELAEIEREEKVA